MNQRPSQLRRELRTAAEVIDSGTPKRGTQVLTRARAQTSVVLLGRGTASGHRVKRSTIVKTYRKPWDGGSGPTKSSSHVIETTLRHGKCCEWDCNMALHLARCQATRLAQIATRGRISCQTNLLAMRLRVARTLGWSVSKTYGGKHQVWLGAAGPWTHRRGAEHRQDQKVRVASPIQWCRSEVRRCRRQFVAPWS